MAQKVYKKFKLFGRLEYLVGARLQEEPDHLQVSLVACQGEGGLLELIGVGVDAGAGLEQDLFGKRRVKQDGQGNARLSNFIMISKLGSAHS